MFHIQSWLQTLGLEQYAAALADNGIDAATLPLLTDADLEKLGVSQSEHRRLFLTAVAEMTWPRQSDRAQASLPTDAQVGERRTVTVLFCAIAGFDRLVSERDAEDLHGLLDRYVAAVDHAVIQHGGRVDKHMGDAVMAVFGAPVAHVNDSERAARAAFALCDATAALSPPLAVRVGIASGLVVTSHRGRETHAEYRLTGAPVNLAARLKDQAEPGEILASAAVAQAVRPWSEATQLAHRSLEGLGQPVPVWRLTRLDSERAVPMQPAPLVGREAELACFTERMEQTARERRGGVVHVRGESGIGKTRLVTELRAMASAAGFGVHEALILDFGDGDAQGPLHELVTSLLVLSRTASVEQRAVAVRTACQRGVIAAHREPYLSDLANVPLPSRLRGRYNATPHVRRAHGKREALLELVRSAAASAPQLMVLEDAHWADSELLGHIVHLARSIADVPVILAVTSQPHVDPTASLAGDAAVALVTLDLVPLAREDALVLASRLAASAPEPQRSRCVDLAGGNPLFLEQLVRSLGEQPEEVLPHSVQSAVLARVDALTPADKRAVQAASAMGQRFSLAALRFLLEDPSYTCERLLAHCLIREDREDEYLFAHALVLEGVYSSLVERARRAMHRRAAAWWRKRDPVLAAEHLDRAEDPGAARSYLCAAIRLGEDYRFERALILLNRGLELCRQPDDPQPGAWGSQGSAALGHDGGAAELPVHELLCLRGEVLYKLGAVEESMASYRRALALAHTDAQRCRAWLGLAEGMRLTDQVDEALELLHHAQAAAEAERLLGINAAIHHLRGNLLFPRGDITGCQSAHERAYTLARAAGSTELEARALSGLGDVCFLMGRMVSAEVHFERCLVLCREYGLGALEVANLPMRATTRYYKNDLARGLRDAREALELAEAVGARRAELITRSGALIWILIEKGELDQALAELELGLELADALGARRFRPSMLCDRGRALVLAGRRAEGVEVLEGAAALCRSGGSMSFTGARTLAALALGTGDPARRKAALAEGEAALAHTNGHNVLSYYRDAVSASLAAGDAGEAERYVALLEAYTRSEPTPWSQGVIHRGRALARHVRGERSDELVQQLERLHQRAQRQGLVLAARGLAEAM